MKHRKARRDGRRLPYANTELWLAERGLRVLGGILCARGGNAEGQLPGGTARGQGAEPVGGAGPGRGGRLPRGLHRRGRRIPARPAERKWRGHRIPSHHRRHAGPYHHTGGPQGRELHTALRRLQPPDFEGADRRNPRPLRAGRLAGAAKRSQQPAPHRGSCQRPGHAHRAEPLSLRRRTEGGGLRQAVLAAGERGGGLPVLRQRRARAGLGRAARALPRPVGADHPGRRGQHRLQRDGRGAGHRAPAGLPGRRGGHHRRGRYLHRLLHRRPGRGTPHGRVHAPGQYGLRHRRHPHGRGGIHTEAARGRSAAGEVEARLAEI